MVILLVLAGLVAPVAATAQGTVRTELSTATITFAAPGIMEFDAGSIEHPGITVTVTSRPGNRPWELRIRATDTTLGTGKPLSDLEWSVPGVIGWTALSDADVPVLQGAGDQSVTVLFRMLLGWATDGPGTYGTGLDFTAVRL